MSSPPGKPEKWDNKKHVKHVQTMSPEEVWEPGLRNKIIKRCGLRPHTIFTLLLRNLGPRTPSGHKCCASLLFCITAAVMTTRCAFKIEHPSRGPRGSSFGPRTKDLASRGPRNLRSRGTSPPKRKPYWVGLMGGFFILVLGIEQEIVTKWL